MESQNAFSTVTRARMDEATAKVVADLRAEAKRRSAKHPQRSQSRQIEQLADMSIRAAFNMVEMVNRELFGPRPKLIDPTEEKQSRIALTLPPEEAKRIHFHESSWWFWSANQMSRVGPFDTEDLAAAGLVNYIEHTKSGYNGCDTKGN